MVSLIDLALYLSSLGHTYVLPYRTLTILLTVSFHLRSSFMSHGGDTYPNLDSPQPILTPILSSKYLPI